MSCSRSAKFASRFRSIQLLSLAGLTGLSGCGGNDGSTSLTGSGGTFGVGGTSTSAGGISGSELTAGGQRPGSGGSPSTGGMTGTAAAPDTGGRSATGGVAATGGSLATGGSGSASGGAVAKGGAAPTGGKSASAGGVAANGGATAGGSSATGGSVTAIGGATAGGKSATGGVTGAAGSSSNITGPCDIYQSGNTPCVAAHSTVRALYGAYNGNLYQVRRASDKTVKDIGLLSPGGVANSAAQDTFCASTTCTISIIYDQSPNNNDLTKAPAGGWLNNGGLEADATKAKIMLNGHAVYGVYTTSNFDNDVGAVGYRNNKTKGVAVLDQPESMYFVVSGKHYNQWCCFDYGNAETNNKDNGPATMETVYFGSSTQWGKGSGSGPWVMADLEDGVFGGGSTAAAPTNTPLVADYVTAMLKGPSGNRFALKGANAQSGALATKYDGTRPSGYSPQKKEGAIILGIGGDNSHTGEGTFFEGCMTSGNPTDDIDDAVQANIVAAGYGR